MTAEIAPPRRLMERRGRIASHVLAGLCFVLGAVVLLGGWLGGIESLRRVLPWYVAMPPSTSVCFMVGSIGTIAAVSDGRWGNTAAAIGAAVVGLVSMANAALMLSQGVGIERYLAPASDPRQYMAVTTATEFLLLAYCLGVLRKSGVRNTAGFGHVATTGLVVALVAACGYAFGSRGLYEVFVFDAMAPHTSLAFLALFLAILLGRPDGHWVATLVGRGAGSATARRIFPIAVIAPFVLGLATLEMTKAGFLSANFRLGLLSIVMMLIGAWAVLKHARSENRSEFAAVHDPLTALPNRALFAERLEYAVAATGRSGGRLGLVMLDLDHFKGVNDTFGHIVGDRLLQVTARRILGGIRAGDMAARMGGDEFAIILCGDGGLEDIEAVARRVCEHVGQPVKIEGWRIEPTASMGLAVFPEQGASTDLLLRHADLALYQAKAAGRNRVCVFDAAAAAPAVALTPPEHTWKPLPAATTIDRLGR